MRFQQQSSSLPEINLIPMLNVMMAVLAFFVMITLSLSGEQAVDVQLPGRSSGSSEPLDLPEPLVVELNAQAQLVVQEQPLDQRQLAPLVRTYLAQNPESAVLLKPDPDLPYEQVVQLLSEMREVGGDRVSLAIDQHSGQD